jgi:hypothetical protein
MDSLHFTLHLTAAYTISVVLILCLRRRLYAAIDFVSFVGVKVFVSPGLWFFACHFKDNFTNGFEVLCVLYNIAMAPPQSSVIFSSINRAVLVP